MRYSAITIPLLFLASGAFAASAIADTTGQSSNERDALLALLNEQTAIATKTKLNADYVPGIVTVLRGDDLEARGYRNVWEALAEVPGIDLFLDSTGRKRLAIRGISDTRYSGNVKIMLNDVAVNATKDSMADPVLNLPIEQVERIEVIRGPGSVVHGEYAYSGVINIITRKEGRRVYGTTDGNGQVGGGLLLSHDTESGWRMGLNLAAQQSKGNQERTGPDALYNTTPSLAAYSYAPGPANTAQESDSAIFNLGYKDFSLLAQWSTDGEGDHYGVNSILPPPQNRIVTRNSYSSVTAKQTFEPGPSWHLELLLGWRETDQNHDKLYLGPAQAYGGSSGSPIILDSAYRESRLDGGMDIHWNGWNRHRILIGLSHSEVRVDESWQKANLDPSTYQPSSTMNNIPTGVSPGTKRLIDAVMLQDEFRYSDLFTLTTGLRYDQYSDVGNRLTPRIAGVWRLDEQHIIKAQYAQAFRPPNFVEAKFSNGDIRPSVIDTYELGYIRKNNNAETRFNIFYSELSDLIIYDSAATKYINSNHAQVNGAELEQILRLTPAISLDANLSYANTNDSSTGQPIPGAAKWLGNLGITTQFTADTKLQLQYRYVGDRQREASDPRSSVPSYQTLDATISSDNIGYRGLTLRCGVKNLFDTTVRYPALMTTDDVGNPIISYKNDFPSPGRIWWAQISYRY